MSNSTTILNRNKQFANNFKAAELPVIPTLRSVILTCADSRVDPTHIFNLDLGESVVMRNTGGRVTEEIIDEIASMAFMVKMMDGKNPGPFEVIIMHHTQCGAQRFADPEFQQALKEHVGVDVSSLAIRDHEESLLEDIERLRNSSKVPNYIIVSGCIYDVKDGSVYNVIEPTVLRQ